MHERIMSIYLAKRIHGVTFWTIEDGYIKSIAIGGATKLELEYYMKHWYPTQIYFGLLEGDEPLPIEVPDYAKVRFAHPKWRTLKTRIPFNVYKSLGAPQKRSFRIGFNEVVNRLRRQIKNTEVFHFTKTWFDMVGRKLWQ